jgi:glyoxylase I family protein
MTIEHVLAVAPVTDLPRAAAWYEQLFGRPPDNRPMTTLVEWRVTDGGWLQVFHDPDRAGSTAANFAVDDLDAHLDQLRGRGLVPGEVQTADKGVRMSVIEDPDGNTLAFLGGFRIHY